MHKIKFRFGELFCGPGGIAWGALSANVKNNNQLFLMEHAWATDYDHDTCSTFAHNICDGKFHSVICEDIRKLDLGRLAEISEIDALAFGFPCNDFSVVGERLGVNGSFGPLYSYGLEAIKRFRPKWFLAENVGGLKNSNEGKTFQLILKQMYEEGYAVFPHLYSFADYGIPQARNRIIIVGLRKDLGLSFRPPSPLPYKNTDISCRTAIECPPIPSDAPNHIKTKQSFRVVERLKYIKPGQNAFTADLPPELQLHVKGAKISQIYRRLDSSKPAYTVTGSGGGGTHMYHWEEPRALTNRERARLQTFPDIFVFKGSKESVRKQIGMAVPCKASKIIIEAILKTFANVPYEKIEPNIDPLLDANDLKLYNQSQDSKQLLLLEKLKKGKKGDYK